MPEFIEVDPRALSDRALQDMIHSLKGNVQHKGFVARLQKEQIRRALVEHGLSREKIIRTLCRSVTLKEAKAIAKEWAPIFGISETDFLKILKFKKT